MWSPPSRGVLLLHKLIAQETGGSIGLQDEALLDSALENAFAGFDGQEFYPTKEEKGAHRIFTRRRSLVRVQQSPPHMKNPNLFPRRSEFGFFIFIKNNSCCYLCPEDGRILRAYLFSHWIPAISSAAVVVPNHRREEPEGIESPSRRLRNISPAPPAAGPAAATRAGTAPAAEGSGMHSRRYP